MSAFRQRLFRQNSLNQDSPKFFLAKVSSFTVDKFQIRIEKVSGFKSFPEIVLEIIMHRCSDSLLPLVGWLSQG